MHENEPDGGIHEQPGCPICRATSGLCGHLLAQIDVAVGEMLGGKFFRHEGPSFETVNDAVTGFIKSIQGKPEGDFGALLSRIENSPLVTLVMAAKEETRGSVDEEGTGMCYDDFLDYLDDLYRELPGLMVTQHDIVGYVAESSLCESYWCEDCEASVELTLQRIGDDAEALRRLAN